MTNTPFDARGPDAHAPERIDRECDLLFAVDDVTAALATIRKDRQATAVIAELPAEPTAATLHAAAVTIAEVARLRRQLSLLEAAGQTLATAALAMLKG